MSKKNWRKRQLEISVRTMEGEHGGSHITPTGKWRLAKEDYDTLVQFKRLEYRCECGELGTQSDLLFHMCKAARCRPTRQIIEGCEGSSKPC